MTRIVSADCHVTEPPWVFDHVPRQFRDRAPKMMRGADGGDGWSFDGRPPKRTLGIESMAGRRCDEAVLSGLTFEEILPGNYDGRAHAADMSTDGVDVSIVYPFHAADSYVLPDKELALHCMRSYNDWVLDEFQAAEPAHLVGLPMLPVDHGMDVTLAEFGRCAAKGAKGMFIPGLPERPYNHEYYEPLWRRASDEAIPLTFHRTFGGTSPDTAYDEAGKVRQAGTAVRWFSAVKPLTYMTYAGIFERHPGLRLVVAEVNHGWVPFWIQSMEQVTTNASAYARLPVAGPREYAGVNIFVTSLDDYVGYAMVANGWPELADMVMYSTDYPHSATLWPDSRTYVDKLTRDLTAEQREKVCSGNAARVYRL